MLEKLRTIRPRDLTRHTPIAILIEMTKNVIGKNNSFHFIRIELMTSGGRATRLGSIANHSNSATGNSSSSSRGLLIGMVMRLEYLRLGCITYNTHIRVVVEVAAQELLTIQPADYLLLNNLLFVYLIQELELLVDKVGLGQERLAGNPGIDEGGRYANGGTASQANTLRQMHLVVDLQRVDQLQVCQVQLQIEQVELMLRLEVLQHVHIRALELGTAHKTIDKLLVGLVVRHACFHYRHL